MILRQIKLSNIRSYLNETIDFPTGSFMLSGDIGSGKTTILLAVEFALFGLMRGVLDGGMLLRHGKQNGFIELTFEIEGKKIAIRRSLKRVKEEVRQDSGYLIIESSRSEATATELKSRVLELLGYPRELLTKSKFPIYRYTVYTPQEEMKQILLENPDYRIDTLRKIFQIDKYKRIGDNSGILLRELKERISGYTGKIEDLDEKLRMRDETAKEMDSKKQDFERALSELAILNKKLLESKEQIKSLENEVAIFNDLKSKLKIAENRVSEKNQLIADLDKELLLLNKKIREEEESINSIRIEEYPPETEILKKLQSKEKGYYEIVEKNSRIREELRAISFKLKELEEEIKTRLSKINQLSGKKEILKEFMGKIAEKEGIKEALNDSELEQKQSGMEIGRVRFSIEDSENVKKLIDSEVCPLCLQPITETHKSHLISEKEEKREELEKRLFSLTNKQQLIDEKISMLKRELDKIIELETKAGILKTEIGSIGELENEIKTKKELISETEKRKALLILTDAAEIKKEISELKELISGINENKLKIGKKEHLRSQIAENENRIQKTAESKNSLENEITGLGQEISKLNEICSELSGKQAEFEKAKHFLEELMEREKIAVVGKTTIENEIKELEKDISVLDSEISRKQKIREKCIYLKKLQNWIEEYFVNLVISMERHVMLTIHREFNELFREWFSMLIEDEQTDARLNEEFVPVIEQNGFETAFENLSGGERTSCALAYRLALNKVINDFMTGIKTKDIIILDEPTDGFSDEQLDKVKEVISRLGAKQIVIVSHESKIESFVDKVIRIEKHEHVSRAVA